MRNGSLFDLCICRLRLLDFLRVFIVEHLGGDPGGESGRNTHILGASRDSGSSSRIGAFAPEVRFPWPDRCCFSLCYSGAVAEDVAKVAYRHIFSAGR